MSLQLGRTDSLTASAAGTPPEQSVPGKTQKLVRALTSYAPVIVLVGLLGAGTALNDNFWAVDNLRNMLVQNAAVAIVAFGMTLVIIAGVFDLSVSATFAAGSVAFATFANAMPIWPAALLSLLVGLAAGAANAFVVSVLRVNSFIGTIATGAVFSGLVFIACNSSPVQAAHTSFDVLGLGRVLGVPWAVICAAGAFLVCGLLLNRTVFGRHVFACGGNPEAAHLNGIPVTLVRMVCFMLVGLMATLGGMITGSQLGLGQPTLGANVALDAFAIVVIGGTSVYGGRGALWRTLTGVLILATLTNIFNAMAWDTTRQSVAKGLIIIAAVGLDALRQSRR